MNAILLARYFLYSICNESLRGVLQTEKYPSDLKQVILT